jgi:hypothetical protein
MTRNFQAGRTFDKTLPKIVRSIFWISVSGPVGRFITIQRRKLEAQ